MLIELPVVLGLAVPPQPLGVAALDTRELNIGQANGALPSAIRVATEKSSADRNIMDWWHLFQRDGATLPACDYHSCPEGSPSFSAEMDNLCARAAGCPADHWSIG